MASTKRPGPECGNPDECICPAVTPGTLGLNDQADPNVPAFLGDTPGTVGVYDYGESLCRLAEPLQIAAADGADAAAAISEEPLSGSVAVGTGMGAVVRIPVPGSGGLFVELRPRGYVPGGGSTSTLFIQDTQGKRHLRLDYGYNKQTGTVDYHWNQKGTHGQFGITDHTPTGPGGKALYRAAKYFRYGGRVLMVVGAAVDIYSIVVARKRWRQAAKVMAGWGGAWLGCKVVGAGGATVGSVVPGKGTAIGGVAGCIAGGIGGYWVPPGLPVKLTTGWRRLSSSRCRKCPPRSSHS